MLYIVMLVFQLVGALILLINVVNGSKEKVISNCYPGSNVVTRDDDNNVLISKEQLQKSANKIYVNIVAFADLLIGYIIAAFSPAPLKNQVITVVVVIAFSIFLVFFEFCIIKLVARIRYSDDIKYSYDNLKKMGVDTNISQKEIDEIAT